MEEIKDNKIRLKKKKYKYEELWKKLLPCIITMLKEDDKVLPKLLLKEKAFTTVGNRKKSGYGFNMVLHNAKLEKSTHSVVASNLKMVLDKNPEAKEILKKGKYKISMSKKYYVLTIQKL